MVQTKKILSRKEFILLLLAVILIPIISIVWQLPRTNWSLKENGQISLASPSKPATGLPNNNIRNVVLISIDTCRADHLGCYGYSRDTSPNIDALAAEGVLFNHAVAPMPTTLPSHSSMLTGTNPQYHKVYDNGYHLRDSNITLAEILKKNGFTTGAFVGSFVMNSKFGIAQGFDTYDDDIDDNTSDILSKKKPDHNSWINDRSGREVTSRAVKWLSAHHKEKFFLFVHYFDPHAPYVIHDMFPFSSRPFLSSPTDRYDSEIAYTDNYIGRIINKLKRLNLYDSSIIIITSDHGEGLRDHGESSHSYFIYHSTIHVPLIIKAPGLNKGKVVGGVVGLIDIVPTICGMLGIAAPGHIQGKNLIRYFSRESLAAGQRYLFCESLYPTKFGLGPIQGIASDRWKYIHTSKPELYDLQKDPCEKKNIFNLHQQQARIMQNQVQLSMKNNDGRDVTVGKSSMDEETKKRLQSLGYVASRMVDENIQFDQRGVDPKKYVDILKYSDEFYSLEAKGKFEKAKELCEKLLKKWPDMAYLHYYLGTIANHQNDPQAKIEHFSNYIKLVESYQTGTTSSIYELMLAHQCLEDTYRKSNQDLKAQIHLQKINDLRKQLKTGEQRRSHNHKK